MSADVQELKLIVARAIWDAMVNDEPPAADTLEREGFMDAAGAAIKVVQERRVITDDMIERGTGALFAHAERHWGWGSKEWGDVCVAVSVVLDAALENPR